MELVKGMPLTFERWRLNFSQLDQDHEVLLTAAERNPDIAALSYCSSIMHDVMILIIIIMDLIPETS